MTKQMFTSNLYKVELVVESENFKSRSERKSFSIDGWPDTEGHFS